MDQIASGPVRRSQLTEFADRNREAANQLVANLERAAELIRSFKQVAAGVLIALGPRASSPPRQVDCGGRLMLSLFWQTLQHPVLLP